MTIPLEAIDPDAQHREWVRQFEYHLDILPPLMEALVWMTLPSIQATRTDQVKITGGGYVDYIPISLGRSPITDATELWAQVVEYVTRVTRSLNLHVHAPWAPTLPPLTGRYLERVDPDPLLARRHALMITGWLIDHADQVIGMHDLQEIEDHLFDELRALRARYGVSPKPRRPRELCPVCGARSVTLVWIDGTNGSPRPVRASRCSACGDTRIGPPVAPRAERAARRVLSETCEAGQHDACLSVHCECDCHLRRVA